MIKKETKQINPVHWYERKSQLCESEHDHRSRNEQPKRLKKNLKKFHLDRESTPDLCADLTQFSIH